MTAAEKASELIQKYNKPLFITFAYAKECASIAVDELIASFGQYTGMYDQEFFDGEKEYWQEVKAEIEKL